MNRSPEDIRTEVSKAYANRVRPVLEGLDTFPVASSCCATDSATDSCCGPAGDATAGGDCCGTAVDGDVQIVRIAEMYAQSGIDDLPATVTDVAFGCGNPTAIAALQPGETVLDLGSGGGIDCFLAAKMVGRKGRVYGVDMTPEMIALARQNAAKVGATNVEFRLGEIEHLPLDADSVDVIISNCVINLAPDKDQVFREALRVLRPGGRLQVSDIVWTSPAPDAIKDDMEQWAGCIAGALLESDYVAKIEAAGFERVTSVAAGYPGGKGLASANVVAHKPR
ncbi:MAG TPA: arsenite methyltransferase [Pirellulales bacterium]|nr:arsenite methyltransferase [Pirellulales bacterium]